MVSKSFLEVMTTVWGSPEECPLFSLHILTHQCHGFPCMRIQFSNSGIVLIFMKDTSALSKNNLFRLDDCKAHLHLHCFISFITYLALFRSAILYFDWIVSEVFFSVHILVYFWGMCVYMRCMGIYKCIFGCLPLTVHVEVNIWHWDVFLNQVKFIVIIIINWF